MLPCRLFPTRIFKGAKNVTDPLRIRYTYHWRVHWYLDFAFDWALCFLLESCHRIRYTVLILLKWQHVIKWYPFHYTKLYPWPWASYKIRKTVSCVCAGNSGNVFPATAGYRSRHAYGTYVMHVPWCIPGSLTSSFLWSRWQEIRARHSRRMHNPQLYVSVVRVPWISLWYAIGYHLWPNGAKTIRPTNRMYHSVQWQYH